LRTDHPLLETISSVIYAVNENKDFLFGLSTPICLLLSIDKIPEAIELILLGILRACVLFLEKRCIIKLK
jgi:hypothetical protein